MTNVNEDMIWKITHKNDDEQLRCHIPSAIFTSFSIHCVIYFVFSSPMISLSFQSFLNEKSLRLKSECYRVE